MKFYLSFLLCILTSLGAFAANDAALRPAVFVKDAPALRGNTSLTIEGFFKFKDIKATPRIFSKYCHLAPEQRGWEITLEEGKVAFRLNVKFAQGGQQDMQVMAPTPVKENKWTHIAAVFADEGNGLRSMALYVDGKRVADKRLPLNCSINSNSSIDALLSIYPKLLGSAGNIYVDELRLIAAPVEFHGVPKKPYTGKEAGTLALFHFDNTNVITAQGITAGIEGQADFVDGVFGKAIDMTGDVNADYFKKAEQYGRNVLLDEAFEGDFRLALFTSEKIARFQMNSKFNAPVNLIASIADEKDPSKILIRKNFTVNANEKKVVEFPIENFKSGRYLLTIVQDGKKQKIDGSMVRLLRIQRPLPLNIPKGVTDVSNERIFPVDDFHFEKRSGVKTYAMQGEKVLEMSPGMKAMQRSIGDDWIGSDAQGNLVQNFMAMNVGKAPDPLRYGIRTADGKLTYSNTMPQGFKPFGPASHSDYPVQATSTDLSPLDDSTVRFYTPADGKIPLDKIRVQCLASHIGDARAKGLLPWATYAVWEKNKGEWLILNKEPLMVAKFGYAERELDQIADSNDNFGGFWMSDDGKTYYYAQAGKFHRFEPFQVKYDNIADSFRIMRVFYTNDGINWKHHFSMIPDETDHWSIQHYGFESKRIAENFYVGLLARYNVHTQQIHPEAWFSRNSLQWERADVRANLADNSTDPHDWRFGMLFTFLHSPSSWRENNGTYYIPLGAGWNKRPHFYFCYVDFNQPEQYTAENLRRIYGSKKLAQEWPFFEKIGGWEGLANAYLDFERDKGSIVGHIQIRRDGFFAVRAENNAELVSRFFKAPDCFMTLNGKGSFTVELLDEKNNPIPGYSGANAAKFNGDSVDAKLTFSGRETLPATPFKVRITMKNSDIYSINFINPKAQKMKKTITAATAAVVAATTLTAAPLIKEDFEKLNGSQTSVWNGTSSWEPLAPGKAEIVTIDGNKLLQISGTGLIRVRTPRANPGIPAGKNKKLAFDFDLKKGASLYFNCGIQGQPFTAIGAIDHKRQMFFHVPGSNGKVSPKYAGLNLPEGKVRVEIIMQDNEIFYRLTNEFGETEESTHFPNNCGGINYFNLMPAEACEGTAFTIDNLELTEI